MSIFIQQRFDQGQQSNDNDDNNFENDDLVTFQYDSKTINFYYSQLTKYSKHIRESYLFSDVINLLPQEIHKFQEEFHLLSYNINYFFQLLQQNYNIKEDSILTYIQCIDLLKISQFLQVRKLSSKINQYIKRHDVDIDFVIQMIEYDVKTKAKTDDYEIEISEEIENLLTNKINECFSNIKFKELPIQIIYRVVKQSSPNVIDNNKLFDIIVKSLSKFCVLFPFLDIQKLSENRLEKLCEMYSKSDDNTQHCFDFLKCNLNFINEMNNRKKNLQKMNDQQQNKMKDLELKISSLQNQLNDSKNLNSEQQNKMKNLETKITSLQNQFNDNEKMNDQLKNQLDDSIKVNDQLKSRLNDSEKVNDQLKNQLNDSKDLNNEQKNQIKNLENQIDQLQKQFIEYRIKGQIVANVTNGLLINAEINLKTKGSTLDMSKSKIIVSTSDVKYLGSEAYEKGDPITSLHMKIAIACKPGTYYVRCIVFNSEGESNEIVSNSVTTSGNSLTFGYEGKPAKISLSQGKYKLEVWGAKGGDSTGSGWGQRNDLIVEGGLGGYSRGILNLAKNETVYVFVGEEGRPSNSSDGSCTEGGFPDGGGTKTGHFQNLATVPGTGGGSTSIRIGSDLDNARVIVAGGGGGASGNSWKTDPGGFGGGLSGENCSYSHSIQKQGAGTQAGSTRGLGQQDDSHGDPGSFGLGATGKYHQGCDSGGGGGGGWYGGGSGGFGHPNFCSSGGGGSGWTFTESSFKAFQSGDSENASKFVLSSAYYLNDVMCVGGNKEFPRPDGNGNESGHPGSGFAKITLL